MARRIAFQVDAIQRNIQGGTTPDSLKDWPRKLLLRGLFMPNRKYCQVV
jgi:hypothetical protein